MRSQIAALAAAGSRSLCLAGSPNIRQHGAGGQVPSWRGANRWASDGPRAIRLAASPIIAKSAGTRWKASPAGRDFS